MNSHPPSLRRQTAAVAAAFCLMSTPAIGQTPPSRAVTPASAHPTQAIEVSGSREAAYVAPNAATSSKTDTPLLETPFSIQVVPRELIDDQQAFTIREAIRNVSGVTQAGYGYYDFVQIRGFENGYAANFRNNLQLQAVAGFDMALVDRIEVVKGPASMLFGRIEPGGLVNMVTLRPQATASASLQQQFGSYGLLRTVGDATGPLDAQGQWLYRLTGAYTEANSFMDYVQQRNAVGAASLTWQPSPAFVLNLAFEAQNYRFVDTSDIGIPPIGDRAAPVARHSFFGDPVSQEIPNQQKRTLLAFDWTWQIDAQWSLTQRAHWDRRSEQQLTLWSNGFDGVSMLDRGLWYVHPERQTLATNLDLVGDLSYAGVRHRILVGADWFQFTSDWTGFSGTTPLVPPVDIWAPAYGISADAIRSLPPNFFYSTDDHWTGLYVQDQMSFGGGWELLVGGRYDIASTGYGEAGTSLADARAALELQTDHAFSPRLGLLYRLAPTASLYASYAKSFGANNGRTASGELLPAEQAQQVELGYKHEAADGSFSVTAAVYQIVKNNLLTADLSTPEPDDQTTIGAVRHRGFEVDLLGRVTPHVNIAASYSYIDSRITQDNDGLRGNRLANVPANAGSVWARFDQVPGGATGWQAGLGVFAQGQRQADNANSWQLPGYARVDAMLRYRLPVAGTRLAAQLNVENLLDRTYIDRGGSGGAGAKYGQPRAVVATLSLEL